MASIKLIRQRIKSAKNIAQITKAMEMVAASKMKKAQERALQGKPYAQKIYEATLELAGRVDTKLNPLLQQGNPDGKTLVVLISTNKGLCGGLNTTLFRKVYTEHGKDTKIEYITVGKKGQSFVRGTGKALQADFSETTPFDYSIPSLTKIIVEGFINGTYKEVFVAYNAFVNALKQEPQIKKILPLSINIPKDMDVETDKFSEFLIEPDPADVLNSLLPHYLENQLRSSVWEAEASEHSARMIAMKNATDAALDLMDNLTLMYNKARQEKITFEIADIVTARMSVA